MKTANSKEKLRNGRLLRRVGKQLSTDRVLDHFQTALVCVDQFGFCAGLITGLFMLLQFLLHAAHSGAEKGVI